MNGLCITDAAKHFGITSKTLRYYERIGLLEAKRNECNNYRYYDMSEVERIKQILILRKMQISVKDIVRIYESEDMSTLVEVFVNRLNALDEEVVALSELRHITSEFLHTMLNSGIEKISALPLLYDEMNKQLDALEQQKPIAHGDLQSVANKLAKTPEIRIITLPPRRVLTSYTENGESNIDDFWSWVHITGLSPGNPGAHQQFEYQDEANQPVIMLAIPNDFNNNSGFQDKIFEGGLFAAASIYADEDLEMAHRAMVKYFDDNSFYQVDYLHDGKQRHGTLIETIMSPDDTRELLDILLPVKRRIPDAIHYNGVAVPKELAHATVDIIELSSHALWKADIPLDKLVPVYKKDYETIIYDVLPDGGIKFCPYVSTRYLSTDTPVRLPFRIDIECKIDCVNGLRLIHFQNEYIINKQSHMSFMQPIYQNWLYKDIAGHINKNDFNRISWIIGEKYFLLVINDEIGYCGIDFPYMQVDFGLLPANPIHIASGGGTLYIRSIAISQLKYTPKIRVKKERFNMTTQQSNNILPNIRIINRGDRAENHEFCGAAAYVMGCIGETTFGEFTDDKNEGLWFFEGLTGDILTPVYSYSGHQGWARSDYLCSKVFIEGIFDKCGYASTFIALEEFNTNPAMYIQTITGYIDKGVPVICYVYPINGECRVICGYEDYGKTLLFLPGSNTSHVEKLTVEDDMQYAWVFVGDKKRDIDIAQVYKQMILDLPKIFA